MTISDYVSLQREIDRINEKLMRLDNQQCTPRIPILTDMPLGGTGDFDQMSNYLIRIDSLRNKQKVLFEEIEQVNKIVGLTEEDTDLIRYRCVWNLTWKQSAKRLEKSERHTHRIYKKILEKFETAVYMA